MRGGECQSVTLAESFTGGTAIPEPLNLTISLRGTRDQGETYQVFRLIGQLDAFSDPAFSKVLDKYAEDGPGNLILDLSGIDFVDSSGLGALVKLHKKIGAAGATLQIIANARVSQTLRMGRLDQFFTLRSSVDEAIAQVPSP